MEQTLLNEIVARVAAKLAEEEGLTYIHPFNDLEVATGGRGRPGRRRPG